MSAWIWPPRETTKRPAGQVCNGSAAAAGFALALALRFLADRPGDLIWICQDFVGFEWGAPYGPGLHDWGLDPGRLVLVRTGDAAETMGHQELLEDVCASP